MLLALADAYQRSGVRRVFEDDTGNEYLRGSFEEDVNGRIEGKFFSAHEATLGRVLSRLDGQPWAIEDELRADLRSEMAFAEGQQPDGRPRLENGEQVVDAPIGDTKWRLDGRILEFRRKLQPQPRKLAKLLLDRLAAATVAEVKTAEASRLLNVPNLETVKRHVRNLNAYFDVTGLPFAVRNYLDCVIIERNENGTKTE